MLWDGEVCPGTIFFEDSFPWDDYEWLRRSVRRYDENCIAGAAFVPIFWHAEDTFSLALRSFCSRVDEDIEDAKAALQIMLQKQESPPDDGNED